MDDPMIPILKSGDVKKSERYVTLMALKLLLMTIAQGPDIAMAELLIGDEKGYRDVVAGLQECLPPINKAVEELLRD